MEKIARVRLVNFTESENEVLVLIINKYKDIVENKKTDNVSNSEKITAWQNIAKEFNSQSPNFVTRSVDSLKKYYDNLKKGMRKRAASERSKMYKTGGGKADTNISKGDELLLSLINKKTIYGYESPWDSDQLECTITNRQDIQDIQDHTYSESWGNDNKENEIVLENETMDAIEIEDDNENFNIEPLIAIADHKNQTTETLQRSWKKYKPADLKKSKSESLRAHHSKIREVSQQNIYIQLGLLDHHLILNPLDLYTSFVISFSLKFVMQSMIIAREKRRHEIHLNGENIEQVEGYKYLVTFIEENRKLDKEMNERVKKPGKMFNSLKISFLGKREIGKEIKTEVIKRIGRPVMLYSSESWTEMQGKNRRDRIRNDVEDRGRSTKMDRACAPNER
ncbi:hypothetical protein MML48_5g00010615 [Holotrichia oblita]|uniref:Uncharacterized protein n=1 Tax=Holotrichia oblita TaxID=644536 RepID=A0ACB9T1M1_HOLOL|nr:hypothetical protein MML48_5g00010615 [Holotrichia oblita]